MNCCVLRVNTLIYTCLNYWPLKCWGGGAWLGDAKSALHLSTHQLSSSRIVGTEVGAPSHPTLLRLPPANLCQDCPPLPQPLPPATPGCSDCHPPLPPASAATFLSHSWHSSLDPGSPFSCGCQPCPWSEGRSSPLQGLPNACAQHERSRSSIGGGSPLPACS